MAPFLMPEQIVVWDTEERPTMSFDVMGVEPYKYYIVHSLF